MKTSLPLHRFLFLAVFGGIAIGMGRVITTFYALHLGADNIEIGYIASVEALSRLIVSLPAGFIVARYGAAAVYSAASLLPVLLHIIFPLVHAVHAIALLRGGTSLMIPFRMVAMNSVFLKHLPQLGSNKVGWYRGTEALGFMVLGPLLAMWFVVQDSYMWGYFGIAAMFAFMAFFSFKVLLPDDAEPDVKDALSSGSRIAFLIQLKEMWKIAAVRKSCILEFMNAATASFFMTFIIVLALNVADLSQSEAVMLVTIQGIGMVATSFVLGYALVRFNRHYIEYLCVAGTVCSLLLIGSGINLFWLAVGTLILSATTALLTMIRTLELSLLPFSKSKIAGIFNLSVMSGGFFGAMAGGFISNWLGVAALFLWWSPAFLLAFLWTHYHYKNKIAR